MASHPCLNVEQPAQPDDCERPGFDPDSPTQPLRETWWLVRLMAAAFGYLTGSRPGGRRATLEAPTYQTVRRGIAREINRARRFERPLSVLVLRTDSLKTTGVEAAVRIALQRLRDTDLWFHCPEAGELVLVAPETGHEAVRFVGRRLATSLGTGDGMPVEWSTATFPVDGLTFEVLYQACQERVSAPAHGRAIESAGLRS